MYMCWNFICITKCSFFRVAVGSILSQEVIHPLVLHSWINYSGNYQYIPKLDAIHNGISKSLQ